MRLKHHDQEMLHLVYLLHSNQRTYGERKKIYMEAIVRYSLCKGKKTHGCGMARANNKITLPVLSKREEDSLLRRSMSCTVNWLSKFY